MTTSKSPTNGFVSRWLYGWLPFWAFSWLVFQSAVAPPGKIPRFLLHINDKVIHATEYFLLCLVAWQAFRITKISFLNRKPSGFAWLYCALFGVLTEVCQLYVPQRSCDIRDWLADAGGAALAVGLIAGSYKWRRRG